MATQQKYVPWGELEDNDEEDLGFLLPPTEVIGPNEKGIKTVIEYKFNDEGKMVKVTRKIQIRKVAETHLNSRAIERRSWSPFGDAVNDNAGGRLTMISNEDIYLERPQAPGTSKQEVKKDDKKVTCVVCRTCGKPGHWTTHCPYKDVLQPRDTVVDPSSSERPVTPGGRPVTPGGPTPSTYIPPSRRPGMSERPGFDMRRRNEENGVRINNLPEETTKQDLQDLCSPFGQVSRVFVATDRDTGLCRGFGTVNFVRRDDAEQAITKLNNYGYDHLILKVEWDRPRPT